MSNYVQNLNSEIPFLYQFRFGVGLIDRLQYESLSISQGLNESREATLTIADPTSSCGIRLGDTIRIVCDTCNFGDWNVISHSPQDQGDKRVSSFQLAPCSDVLRCSAISGATIFDEQTNAVAFSQIPGYLLAENGAVVNLSFVNFSALNLGARFNTGGRNVLELLRSLSGATGNSFRMNCNGPVPVIEVGAFGQTTGLSIGPGGWPNRVSNFYYQEASYEHDGTDSLGCIYVEGGSYTRTGVDTADTLLMGSLTDAPPYASVVPPGFTLATVTRLGKQFFRMCTNPQFNNCTRSIQISSVTPVRPDVYADRVAASQLLTDIAVKYLTLKSLPQVKITYKIAGIHCQFHNRVGDFVDCTYCCNIDPANGGGSFVLENRPLYLLNVTWDLSGDQAFTTVEFSNWLYNPDELLTTSNINKNNKGETIPYVGNGVVTNTFNLTANFADPICSATGREVIVNYSATGYSAVPSISVTGLPVGWSFSITSATRTQVVLCIIPPALFPVLGQTLTVTVAGPV